MSTSSCAASTTSADTQPDAPSLRSLCSAAIAAHNALRAHALEHVFLGGFALAVLGSDRPTNAVDIEVRKRLFTAAPDRLRAALAECGAFEPVSCARPHTLCVEHLPTGVVVHLMMRGDSHMFAQPAQPIVLGKHSLPFAPIGVLLYEKLRCAAERFARADAEDLFWLSRYRSRAPDAAYLRAKAGKSTIRRAVAQHQTVAPVLQSLGLIH